MTFFRQSMCYNIDKTALLSKRLKHRSVVTDFLRHVSQRGLGKTDYRSQIPKRLGHAGPKMSKLQ